MKHTFATKFKSYFCTFIILATPLQMQISCAKNPEKTINRGRVKNIEFINPSDVKFGTICEDPDVMGNLNNSPYPRDIAIRAYREALYTHLTDVLTARTIRVMHPMNVQLMPDGIWAGKLSPADLNRYYFELNDNAVPDKKSGFDNNDFRCVFADEVREEAGINDPWVINEGLDTVIPSPGTSLALAAHNDPNKDYYYVDPAIFEAESCSIEEDGGGLSVTVRELKSVTKKMAGSYINEAHQLCVTSTLPDGQEGKRIAMYDYNLAAAASFFYMREMEALSAIKKDMPELGSTKSKEEMLEIGRNSNSANVRDMSNRLFAWKVGFCALQQTEKDHASQAAADIWGPIALSVPNIVLGSILTKTPLAPIAAPISIGADLATFAVILGQHLDRSEDAFQYLTQLESLSRQTGIDNRCGLKEAQYEIDYLEDLIFWDIVGQVFGMTLSAVISGAPRIIAALGKAGKIMKIKANAWIIEFPGRKLEVVAPKLSDFIGGIEQAKNEFISRISSRYSKESLDLLSDKISKILNKVKNYLDDSIDLARWGEEIAEKFISPANLYKAISLSADLTDRLKLKGFSDTAIEEFTSNFRVIGNPAYNTLTKQDFDLSRVHLLIWELVPERVLNDLVIKARNLVIKGRGLDAGLTPDEIANLNSVQGSANYDHVMLHVQTIKENAKELEEIFNYPPLVAELIALVHDLGKVSRQLGANTDEFMEVFGENLGNNIENVALHEFASFDAIFKLVLDYQKEVGEAVLSSNKAKTMIGYLRGATAFHNGGYSLANESSFWMSNMVQGAKKGEAPDWAVNLFPSMPDRFRQFGIILDDSYLKPINIVIDGVEQVRTIWYHAAEGLSSAILALKDRGTALESVSFLEKAGMFEPFTPAAQSALMLKNVNDIWVNNIFNIISNQKRYYGQKLLDSGLLKKFEALHAEQLQFAERLVQSNDGSIPTPPGLTYDADIGEMLYARGDTWFKLFKGESESTRHIWNGD